MNVRKSPRQKFVLQLHSILYFAIFAGTIWYDLKVLNIVTAFRKSSLKNVLNERQQRSILQETPMRSSIINVATLLVILPLLILLLYFDDLEVEAKTNIALSTLNGLLMIKSPLIVAWTFRKYQSNMNTNQNEERERKRKIEIQEAQRRQLQIALKRLDAAELEIEHSSGNGRNHPTPTNMEIEPPSGNQIIVKAQIEPMPDVQC